MTRGRHSQSGMTLVVSLIMLIVLTLLVVSAIRFGNINLKVAANAQVDAEASAAAQVAIEQMMLSVNDADKIDEVPAMPQTAISTGGSTYKIDVAKPGCVTSRYVMSTELNYTISSDRLCYGGGGADQILTSTGAIASQPTECKSQTWEIQASLNDATSGANLTMVQGVSARVGQEVTCPN